MKYRVTILPRAMIQLYAAAGWWADNRSVEQAIRWLQGFEVALQALQDDPERLPLANENHLFEFPLR